MVANAPSLQHNYTSAHIHVSEFVPSESCSILEEISKELLSQKRCQNPKIISKETTLNSFQVKDTFFFGNSFGGLCCCTFPRTIYIIHCLQPKSRDLYKEQADKQRENRWHFISCRESERVCARWREYGLQYVFCLPFVGKHFWCRGHYLVLWSG